MKIKTVITIATMPETFDEAVNTALEDGWRLVKREVLAGKQLSATAYNARVLYAELAKMDEEPAEPNPAPLDPLAPLRAIQAYCKTVPAEDCQNDLCPLAGFCDQIRRGKSPDEWELPGRNKDGK